MNDAIRHYDQLLAEHYSWMVGAPFERKAAEQKALLTELGIGQGAHGLAIDLGCGPGYQSAALADLGFSRVIAIDASQTLLDELSANKERARSSRCATISAASPAMPRPAASRPSSAWATRSPIWKA